MKLLQNVLLWTQIISLEVTIIESFFSILTGKFRPDALVSFNGLSKVNYDDVIPSSTVKPNWQTT
jgi:hypothetical protein